MLFFLVQNIEKHGIVDAQIVKDEFGSFLSPNCLFFNIAPSISNGMLVYRYY